MMKPDELGLTKVVKRSRQCNICGKQYNINTSSNIIYIHACRHKEFHGIIRNELGEQKFQEKLNALPKNFKFEDYNCGGNIESKFELSPSPMGSLITNTIMTRKRKASENGDVTNEIPPSLPAPRNISTRSSCSSRNETPKNNADLSLKDLYFKDGYSKRISIDKVKVNINDAAGISDVPEGFRKSIKTDVLGLTKLVSLQHRICLACNRQFQSTCGVTSLYKHCIRHPEHRTILKKNLATTAYINALKNAHIPYTPEDIQDDQGHPLVPNMTSYYNSPKKLFSDNSLNALLEKAKGYDCLNKLSSSFSEVTEDFKDVDQFNDNVTMDDSTLSKLLFKHEDDEKKECEEDISSRKSFRTLLTDFIKVSELPHEFIERSSIFNFLTIFKGKNANNLIKDILNENQLRSVVTNETLHGVQSFTLSLEEYKKGNEVAGVVKIYYCNSASILSTQNLGIIHYDKNEMCVNKFERLSDRIIEMITRMGLKMDCTTPFISNGSLFSKRFAIKNGVTEIPCLRSEIMQCLIDIQNVSQTLFKCLSKAVQGFSLYKYVIDKEIEISSEYKLLKNIKKPTQWVDIYDVLCFGIRNIKEASVLTKEYWSGLVLSDDELFIVTKFIQISKPIIETLNLLSSEDVMISKYCKVVINLCDKLSLLDLDLDHKCIVEDLSSFKAVPLENIEKISNFSNFEEFDIPVENVVTGITCDSVKNIFTTLHDELIKSFDGLKTKSKKNEYICRSLLVDPQEAYKKMYGDSDFWLSIENLFDLNQPTEENLCSSDRINFSGGVTKSCQLYRSLLYGYGDDKLKEFWNNHKSILPGMYDTYMKFKTIPVAQKFQDKGEDIFDWLEKVNSTSEVPNSDMYFTGKVLSCDEVIVIE
uniref:C2H2-type domain-containing protein n=1 Tax=Parastrongyloides trichosuri TaxID=131310 RepID=A0A0N4ZJ20_PARTI